MNPNYTEFKFPQIKAHPWHKVISHRNIVQHLSLALKLSNISDFLVDSLIRYSTSVCLQRPLTWFQDCFSTHLTYDAKLWVYRMDIDLLFSLHLLYFSHSQKQCFGFNQIDALIHPFFDELRDQNSRLPNGRFLPPLFNFKAHGKISCFFFTEQQNLTEISFIQFLIFDLL